MSVPGRSPALGLAGPTASGKSALAMEIARRWPVEIVSVDSALVYRGMDIGSAKPDAAARATVAHHLIDVRDPAQPYSAAAFVAASAFSASALAAASRAASSTASSLAFTSDAAFASER